MVVCVRALFVLDCSTMKTAASRLWVVYRGQVCYMRLVYGVQLSVHITAAGQQMAGLRELTSGLLRYGDDVEIASLSGRLRAQRRRLEDAQSRHDVSVCTVKFRPATTTTAERASLLGKLVILDEGL